ncbi:MAG: hypothetical protein U0457_12775 [Candidatus Sericytochromatia bacterium]
MTNLPAIIQGVTSFSGVASSIGDIVNTHQKGKIDIELKKLDFENNKTMGLIGGGLEVIGNLVSLGSNIVSLYDKKELTKQSEYSFLYQKEVTKQKEFDFQKELELIKAQKEACIMQIESKNTENAITLGKLDIAKKLQAQSDKYFDLYLESKDQNFLKLHSEIQLELAKFLS